MLANYIAYFNVQLNQIKLTAFGLMVATYSTCQTEVIFTRILVYIILLLFSLLAMLSYQKIRTVVSFSIV